MNPIERGVSTICGFLQRLDDLTKPVPVADLGDAPWVPTPEDDQGEALEPQPRTVDWLGPDERDAVWISKVGRHWKWEGGHWCHEGLPDIWVRTPHGYVPNASGPYVEATAQPMTWLGWAVPAILEVLAEHQPFGAFEWHSWSEDVAPLIAARIGCDPQRAISALRNFQPDRVDQ